MRLLYFMPEAYPTFRPDITALFGKYLPLSNICSDLVGYRASENDKMPEWGGGKALLGPAPEGRFRRMPGRILHFLKTLSGGSASRYDAIQVRDMPIMAAFALLRAQLAGVPFIYWMSFPVPEMEMRMAAEKRLRWGLAKYLMLALRGRLGSALLYTMVLPRADHIFVQSDRMKLEVARKGIAMDTMTAVPMCIDPMDFAPEASWADNVRDTYTIAYLGTCEKARRVDFLFEVLAALRQGGRNVRLLLVGDAWLPEEQIWLRQRAEDLNVLEQVTITGWLSADEGRNRLLDADLAISIVPPDPLLDVGSPTKLVEYLALGMPVVANDHPDQRDVLARSGAGLCAPFEVDAFVAAIASMHDDRAAAAAMARGGPGFVRCFRNYETTARTLATIYENLLLPQAAPSSPMPDGTL